MSVNDVKDSVNAAMAHYQIWFTLCGKGKAIEQYLNDMNDYSYVDFFHAANVGNYKLMGSVLNLDIILALQIRID
jgi:hypothetical protein